MNPSGYVQLDHTNPGAPAYSAPGPAPFMPLSAVQTESVLVPAGAPLVSVRLESSSRHCSSESGPFAEDSYSAAIAPYVTRDTYTELMGRVLQASRPTVFELGLRVIGFLLVIGSFILFSTLFFSDLSDNPLPTALGSFGMMFFGAIVLGVGGWFARGWREERVRRAVTDASNTCVQRRLPLYWRVTKEAVGRWVRGTRVVGTIYAFTVEILLLAAVPQPRMQAADWAYAPGPGVYAAY